MVIQSLTASADFVRRVHHVHGAYRLPDDLPEGAKVRVLAFHTDSLSGHAGLLAPLLPHAGLAVNGRVSLLRVDAED